MTGNTVSPTPAQGWPIPVDTDDPDVAGDVASLARLIEKRVMGVYATTAARNSATTAAGVQEGMFAYTMDTNSVWYYDGAAWQPFPPVAPTITSGTTVPSNGTGNNGDIYFKV